VVLLSATQRPTGGEILYAVPFQIADSITRTLPLTGHMGGSVNGAGCQKCNSPEGPRNCNKGALCAGWPTGSEKKKVKNRCHHGLDRANRAWVTDECQGTLVIGGVGRGVGTWGREGGWGGGGEWGWRGAWRGKAGVGQGGMKGKGWIVGRKGGGVREGCVVGWWGDEQGRRL